MTASTTLHVNNHRFFHQMEVREIGAPFDVLAWLKEEPGMPKFFWKGRDGVEMAACGAELMFHDVPVFGTANASPARFYGGHAFFPTKAPKDDLWQDFPRCGFFLPQIELIDNGKVTTLIRHAINRPLPKQEEIISKLFDTKQVGFMEGEHLPQRENWDEMICVALEKIRNHLFQKVVMARRSTHICDSKPDPYGLLAQVQGASAIRFAVQLAEHSTFIGVTPERLYLREGLDLYTEALGGTASLEEAESRLLTSKKDLQELQLIKISLHQALAPLCQSFQCQQQHRLVSTPKVRHLYSPFRGVLKEGVCDEHILAALHPTAAMGGIPKSTALQHLEKAEPFERGWYASPIGYISPSKAELCVGIRSALVSENQLHLFAGAGIVAGSEPGDEWEELQHKTSLWTDASMYVKPLAR